MIQIIRPIKQLVDNLVTQDGYKLDAYTYEVRIEFNKLVVNVYPIERNPARDLKRS